MFDAMMGFPIGTSFTAYMKTKKLVTVHLIRVAISVVAIAAAPNVTSQTAFEEQVQLVKAPTAVAHIGADLFGDSINMYTGTVNFRQTDVGLRGNNALPVAVGRTFDAGAKKLYVNGDQFAFGQWQLDMPYMKGIFSQVDGWSVWPTSTSNKYARCTHFSDPTAVSAGGAGWDGGEFWYGNSMYIPGVGEQRMLLRDSNYTAAPNSDPSSYPVVTSKKWAISCLPNLANDASGTLGEGFLAVSPEGVKYRFDQMVSSQVWSMTKGGASGSTVSTTTIPPITEGTGQGAQTATGSGSEDPQGSVNYVLPRKEVRLLVTLITDRFGNWVRYNYDPNRPANVTSITSSDTRTLSFRYDNASYPHLVTSVSDGVRTWTYSYAAIVPGGYTLTTLTLPDASTWNFAGMYQLTQTVSPDLNTVICGGVNYLTGGTISGSMTHPSGATGTFTMVGMAHGRSDVPQMCRLTPNGSTYAGYPIYIANYSLTNKRISGPGVADINWNYAYGPANASFAPCSGTCPTSKTVTVTDPNGFATRYTFGNRYKVSEGRLEQVDAGWDGSAALSTTTTRYRSADAGPYPATYGSEEVPGGDSYITARPMLVDQRVTVQQGTNFTWAANSFDTFARVTSATKSSSLGMSRTETTTFSDNLPLWVLDQVASVVESSTGKAMVEMTYDPSSAMLQSTKRFGKLQESLTYYADGTTKTSADGKNPATTFSNYKRGVAQRIDYPDGSYETAVVDNLGNITSLTNEAASTHTFRYDALGRLSAIVYPSADTVAWNQTTLSFGQIGSQEYDLGGGHWKQTVTTGTATEVSYFDALLRPVYVERYDSADVANTSRIVKHQYDFAGHPTFESYPQRSYQNIAGGIHNEYDVLGRITGRSTDSELGTLYEEYGYSSGFQKSYTDAKGNTTYYTYQAFDQPTEETVIAIAMPEGVGINIGRDIFGKTQSIVRSGAGLSQTRSYVYDAYERLCKTIEPETGATVQDYDLANNVSWRATGLSLTSPATCETTSVAATKKASFTYDARNRLKDTTFGDGSFAINRTYTLDGLPETVSSNGTKWTYTYNKRRLLEGESLVYGSGTYSIGRTYDTNGSLSQLRYPVDNLTVAYNPNALGEPRQAGSYATAVTYHPSGTIAGFTYGNGIRRTMAQNTRGLPSRSTDTGVLDESYTYDRNANVDSITDQLQAVATRSMNYDGLDRLKTTSAPNLWGTATYGYDSLDNLISTSITAGQNARSTVHNIDYAKNRLASITNGPANFNFVYGYDSQGNITSRGAQTYQFDLANRMTAAPGRATYVYDGLGRRVSVVGTDGVNRIQVYSQGGQLLYVAPSGSAGTKYIYLHNHQIAEVK
jgi:YD repeat-containing protein